MSITFTRGAETFSPHLRGLFSADQEATTVEHVHLDGSIGYDLGVDRPRKGEWRLFFLTADDAEAARQMLQRPGPWVVDDDTAGVSMTIVRSGRMRQAQQDSRKRWVLEVGFAEVPS